uniref:Photosystem I assembly protein Ycf4 n=1 Tax=Callithamnion tetricum TaxID=193179 RepID=A0A4D6WQG3_9FLOR|nr:photosystem I assembly protein Ycf4 [Callithamnion tetricum]
MSNIKIDNIIGSRRLSNYWWATVIFIGGCGFFIVGLSSYLQKELLVPYQKDIVVFLPNGLVMTFYGTIGIFLSIFLWLTIAWNVGAGYNEFNNEQGLITIFRLGFPGKNRVLKLQYKNKEVNSIKVNIKDGLNPKREIFLKTKDKREIPLTNVSQPLLLSEIEEQARNIALFLGVSLEGIE